MVTSGGTAPTLAAKAATATIPVVFAVPDGATVRPSIRAVWWLMTSSNLSLHCSNYRFFFFAKITFQLSL
jgi:hypothetical protein